MTEFGRVYDCTYKDVVMTVVEVADSKSTSVGGVVEVVVALASSLRDHTKLY